MVQSQFGHPLKDLTSEFEVELEETKKRHLQTEIACYQAILGTMPQLEKRLPDIAFTGRLQIHGSNRAVKLIGYQNEHIRNDVVLSIPSESILFMSDLLFVDTCPFLANGYTDKLSNILDELDQKDAYVLLPGHGPVGDHKDLKIDRRLYRRMPPEH